MSLLLALALPLWAAGPLQTSPLRDLNIGEPAPAFSLKDTRGQTHSLTELKGKPVVLCYGRLNQELTDKALSALRGLHAKWSRKDVVFLAVVDPSGDTAAAARLAARLPFPLLLDARKDLYAAYGLYLTPSTVVLDKAHRIDAAISSFRPDLPDELEVSLAHTLGLRVAAKPKRPPPDPEGNSDPDLNLARKLLETDQPKEALPLIEKTIARLPGSSLARQIQAEALIRMKRYPEAKQALDKALANSPGSKHALTLMGRVLMLEGKLREAEKILLQALALNPKADKIHYYLGRIYEETGRKEEALKEYRASLSSVFQD
ncbi:MAG: hypothetical protein A2X36_08295 [Elusimicrobia bacterium GWA2_69_24]|nr:MAG: hypothetical protein A2X36_08295 [Elusimicrobia bacterium GWA2_69_24]